MRELPIKNMIGITENYLIKKYPNFYYNLYNTIKIDNIKLSEKLWLYKNELNSVPICPNCGNKLKYRNLNIGYRKYCSKKCAAEYSHRDPIIKAKRISNMLECNFDSNIRLSMTQKSNNTKRLKFAINI